MMKNGDNSILNTFIFLMMAFSILTPLTVSADTDSINIISLGHSTSRGPPIIIHEPLNNSFTNYTPIEIVGTTNVGTNITINEKNVTVNDNGDFQEWIELNEGENKIIIRGKDYMNNTTEITFIITLDTRTPILITSSPDNNIWIKNTTILVEGLTEIGSKVTVNGKVVQMDDWNFSTNINLSEGENTIWVRSCDKVNNCNITKRIVNVDTIIPILEILSPMDGLVTNKTSIEFTGYTEPGLKLKINGDAIALNDGNFTRNKRLTEGLNVFYFEVEDIVGNLINKSVSVILDTIPPNIVISNHNNGSVVNSPNITIEGHISESGVLYVQDNKVDTKTLTFSTTIKLREGKNDIQMVVTDHLNNYRKVIWIIYLDTKVNVTVGELIEGSKYRTKEPAYRIKGVADKDANVTVNGKTVQYRSNDKFEIIVPLEIGNNTITVTATDTLKNEVKKEYVIEVYEERKVQETNRLYPIFTIPVLLIIVFFATICYQIIKSLKT